MKDRVDALEMLLTLGTRLEDIRSRLAAFQWNSEHELVTLAPDHAVSVLNRFLSGQLSADEVEEWANLIEGRDDIGLHPRHMDALRELIWELANPLLARPLTPESAREWIQQLNR